MNANERSPDDLCRASYYSLMNSPLLLISASVTFNTVNTHLTSFTGQKVSKDSV